MEELKSPDKSDTQTEVSRIKTRITELTGEHFAKGESTYYLSQLGIDLGSDRALLESLTGMKLGRFIRENFSFEIGVSGSHRNIFYLIAPGTTPSMPSAAPPRYAPRFWAAFTVPLQEGEQRVINLDTLEFGSRDSIGVNGVDVRPILDRFVAPAGHSASSVETAKRILAFRAKVGWYPFSRANLQIFPREPLPT